MAPKRFLDESNTEGPQPKRAKCGSEENTENITKFMYSNNSVSAQEIIQNKTLHEAAKNGYSRIVRHFLKQNTNINEKNGDGKTPLHLASANGHLDVVSELLISGANVNLLTDHKTLPKY